MNDATTTNPPSDASDATPATEPTPETPPAASVAPTRRAAPRAKDRDGVTFADMDDLERATGDRVAKLEARVRAVEARELELLDDDADDDDDAEPDDDAPAPRGGGWLGPVLASLAVLAVAALGVLALVKRRRAAAGVA